MSTITLTCSVTAQPPPSYKWFRIDSTGNNALKNITGDQLQFDEVVLDDRGIYMCSAANELGVITSKEAILSIQGE